QNATVTVNCKIYAIQQANLSEADAFTKLYPKVNFVTSANWKSAIPNYVNLTSIGFYDKKDSGLTGYVKDDELTANLDAKLTSTDQNNLEVWKKSSTEIAFVSDKVIMAPSDSSWLFSDTTETNRLTNLTSIAFNNFNTSKVTTTWAMFYACSSLLTLDVSGFNTISVTSMRSMFSGCRKLTSLDVSNFNTSSVIHMGWMFENCISLTTLDLSSFNTSKVTNWVSMFFNTFSNSPSTSSLKISSNFTYKNDSGVATQFDSKTTLNSKTSLDTSVTVIKDGATLPA
ncbi:MAG: BspA family leucine-rich repeat surface protein, partial [Christensenellales bacterium]